MIYNYLFFHGYILASKSKSNKDMPIFIPILFVLSCLILNISALLIFISGLGLDIFLFKKEYRLLWAIFFMLIVFGYYLYKNKYRSILSHFRSRGKKPPTTWFSIFIVFSYYLISISLLFLASFYYNKSWIFAE